MQSNSIREFVTLSLQTKNLKALSYKSSLYLLESIPKKKKLNIYIFDPISKVLKHLYLASLENLLYATIFEGKLFRMYITQNSVKLSTDPNSIDLNNYKTETNSFDLIVILEIKRFITYEPTVIVISYYKNYITTIFKCKQMPNLASTKIE